MPAAAAAVLKEQDFILSSLAPSPAHKRLALAVVVVLLLALLAMEGPFANVRLPRVEAFFPTYAGAMFVNDTITALLLLAQFSILRSRALLAISCGYLFTALMLIPRTLTGGGLLGAGLQSTTWLYLLSHAGFPVLVIAYVLLKRSDAARPWTGSVRAAITSSVGVTAGVVIAATCLIIAADPRLPRLMIDNIRFAPLWPYVAAIPMLLSVAAIVVLLARRRSVLDLWLMVAMCAYVIEIVLVWFPVPARFSMGWYGGLAFGVLSGSFVLLVLLYEISALYARLLHAVAAERRERAARLMTGDAVSASIAHEIRQPLAAITTNADAGLRWLGHDPPDLSEAAAALDAISTNGRRATAVVEAIRAMFRKDPATRASVDLDELVSETLDLLRGDLSAHRISVRTESSGPMPRVTADRVQLQQVFLNLISNAIEAMAWANGPRELCVRSTVDPCGAAVVAVSDTGPGVAPKDMDQIFSPLFSTKAHGMGMGLSICRSIVEAHDGQLWVTANRPHGAVFQVLIPADGAAQADGLRAVGG